jgi:hypothetical protein
MKLFRSLTIILAVCSFAFCFELKTIPDISPTAFLKWDLREGPIAVSLDHRGSADMNLAQTEHAVVAALNVWQGVAGQSVRFRYDGLNSLQGASGTDEVNSVQWVESGWEYSSHAIAVTSYSYYLEDPPVLVDADIFMNGQNYMWNSGATNSRSIDAQQTLIHEFGHLLGISHTGVKNAQMFPFLSGPANHQLSRDDKAALKFLYGTPISFFAAITPVANAKYAENLSSRGLPLPIFRWNPGPDSNYVIEFSNSRTFEKKIRVSAGSLPFYQLKPIMERRLRKLSGPGKVFWRVRSGSSVTPTRGFRLHQ